MRAVVAVGLMLAAAWAGCVGDPLDVEVGTDAPDDDQASAAVDAPEWAIGDWWNYTDSFGSAFSLVVSGESGADWITDTDNPAMAFVEAQFSDISYIGRISKAGLVGQQGSSAVRYFDFPLEDSKTWSTRWDGQQVQVTAAERGPGSFQMEGVVDENLAYRYTYSESSRFLESLEVYRADGSLSYQMELQASGRGFAAELVRVQAEEIMNVTGIGPLAETGTLDFAGIGDADMVAGISMVCQTGGAAFAIGPAENVPGALEAPLELDMNEDGYSAFGPCPDTFGYFGVIGRHLDQGTWGYTLNAASEDAVYSVVLWLRHFERITL